MSRSVIGHFTKHTASLDWELDHQGRQRSIPGVKNCDCGVNSVCAYDADTYRQAERSGGWNLGTSHQKVLFADTNEMNLRGLRQKGGERYIVQRGRRQRRWC